MPLRQKDAREHYTSVGEELCRGALTEGLEVGAFNLQIVRTTLDVAAAGLKHDGRGAGGCGEAVPDHGRF